MLTHMATQVQRRLTVEQYLDQERRAEVRSEYLDGETFVMAAASLAHNVALAAKLKLSRIYERVPGLQQAPLSSSAAGEGI